MPLSTEVDLGPGDIVLDGPSSRTEMGTAENPHFRGLRTRKPRPMSTVAKRSPISATAEHLFRQLATVCLAFRLN